MGVAEQPPELYCVKVKTQQKVEAGTAKVAA